MVRMRGALSALLVFLWGVFSFALGQLTILWPDVEQGACMLVVGPEIEGVRIAMLVDAGTIGKKPEENPITTIEGFCKKSPSPVVIKYVVITHQHRDHDSWLPALEGAGLFSADVVKYTYETAVPGTEIDLGGGAVARIVIANGKVHDGKASKPLLIPRDENDRSVGMLISFWDFQAWVGGDLSERVEQLLIPYVKDVDVYVMHHHGSRYSSSRPFLDVLKPEVSICQVGDGNPYGHPSKDAVKRVLDTVDTDGDNTNGTPIVILQNRGSYSISEATVYVADPDGPGGLPGIITLTTDGWSYRLQAPGFPNPMTFSTDEQPKYRLSLVSNNMPVYHSKEYWVLIVYPEGADHGTILCVNSSQSLATIFERELRPGEQVALWIAAVDPERYPDIGQTLYRLTIPALHPGESIEFSVGFTIFGESGGPATMTFKLERLQ